MTLEDENLLDVYHQILGDQKPEVIRVRRQDVFDDATLTLEELERKIHGIRTRIKQICDREIGDKSRL